MEFPSLGKHCTEPTCNQLDFLPVKCDACTNTFCSEHYKYEKHNCPASYQKNVQVPICPLCNKPVPGKSDELPDIRVSRHIDSDCQNDRAVDRRKKIYTNRCAFKGCKQKELIPVLCDRCGLNYCLRHRHAEDHACVVPVGSKPMSKSAMAALSRTRNNFPKQKFSGKGPLPTSPSPIYNQSNYQGNLTEDAALAMALHASVAHTHGTSTEALSQQQEDFILAQALAASDQEVHRKGQDSRSPRGDSSQKSCVLS